MKKAPGTYVSGASLVLEKLVENADSLCNNIKFSSQFFPDKYYTVLFIFNIVKIILRLAFVFKQKRSGSLPDLAYWVSWIRTSA